MKHNSNVTIVWLVFTLNFLMSPSSSGQSPQASPPSVSSIQAPSQDVPKSKVSTLEAARGRAKLLHATIHSVLQQVHRDFYREDQRLPLPARTLESVFDDLARECNVQVRWLAVQGATMSFRHQPQDEFERNAVKALDSGEKEFELLENKVYRLAGAITLHNQCLKCHVPDRTSTEPRTAGLVITIEIED